MNERPLISVIIPAYNAEDTLDRCLDSITRQTYHNLEIIIVNDGSTDSTPSICDSWKHADGRVKVIHQSNAGVSGARNTGLQAVTGDLLTWVDSDDWIDSDFISQMYEVQCLHDVDTVIAQSIWHFRNESFLELRGDNIMKYHILGRLGHSLWGTLSKTHLYHGLEFKNLCVGEDVILLGEFRARCSTAQVHNIDGYHYVIHEGSAVHRSDISSKWEWIHGMRYEDEFVEHVYPQYMSCLNYARMICCALIFRQTREYMHDEKCLGLRRYLRKEILKRAIHIPWKTLQKHERKEVAAAIKVALLG